MCLIRATFAWGREVDSTCFWWWCSCCGGVVVGLWWCCGGGVVLLLWLLFGSGVVLLNMENYEDDPVSLTCRSKLTLIKEIRKKFRNTFREELFRKTCFGWLLDLDDSQENCVLIHFMSCRQVERSPEDTVVVPLTYHVNGHYIEFGREEFCLITGLRFGPEFSDRYEVGPIPFRRLVFDSDKDGGHVNGQMLLDIINGEEFDNLHDEVAVAVCQLAVLHFVLLGRQLAHNIPDWWLRLIDDKNGTWEIYPWGTLVWAQLYDQLENANVVRAEKLYAAQNRPIPRAAKYTLSGFTWAFKGARPNRRLRPDAFEARAEWWVRSREFFDGRIHEAPPIPTLVKLPRPMFLNSSSLRQTLLKKLEIELQAEVTLANKLSCELTRVAEQMRIREIHTAMLHAMPLTSLNTYGLHALLMTHESDIRITHNLRTTRDELLRSIAEKQKFIDNYRAI
ncbi:phospholipase-like protein [Tanacetum coccineum]